MYLLTSVWTNQSNKDEFCALCDNSILHCFCWCTNKEQFVDRESVEHACNSFGGYWLWSEILEKVLLLTNISSNEEHVCVFLTCLFCQPDSSLSLWNRTSRHVYSRSIHWTILQWTKTTTKIWTLLLCALELFSFILTINGSIPHSILWITHEILEAVVLSLCYSTSSLITSNFSRSENLHGNSYRVSWAKLHSFLNFEIRYGIINVFSYYRKIHVTWKL